MKGYTLPLSLLLAAPLFSTLSASSPAPNPRSQQIVLADVEDATRLDSTLRQGDLIDSIIAEAESKGQDLSSWGIFSPDDKVDSTISPSEPTIESVDLNDEAAKAKLMWEAAMENTIISIQPLKKVSTSVKATVTQPGSGWVWQACGSGQEAAVLQELNVKPDPPVAGQNLTVKAKGYVNSPIHEGTYADVVVKLGFIKLLSRRFDICQLAEDNDAEVKCPIEPGEYEITHTAQLPKEIPPAKFNVHVTGKTHEDIDFVCTDLSIDFMHH